VVHRMDDRTSPEEQQCLEEGVREQVEHRGAIGARARSEEHVAELRTGRVSDDALDVPLRRRDGRGEEAGRGADRSEEPTSELQSLMRTSYAVFCWKKKT